jgi:phosphate transport system permease protein
LATTIDPATPGRLSVADLRGDPGRLRTERAVRLSFAAAAGVSLLVSVGIVYSLVSETWTFVSQVEWSTLLTDGWYPRAGLYDLRTIVAGSLIVTGVAIVLAGPIGLATAIYLSEYARPRVRRVLKPAIEILAGIPSVVLGFFALTWIAPNVTQRFFEGSVQANLLVAGLGVGILTIPLVASVSEDALRSVPSSLREASYGLGAKKVTTSVKVVLPAAVSGLVAACILAISRALGETMVVFIAAGGGNGANYTLDPLRPGLTMTAAMATQAAGTDAVVGADLTYQSLFFVGSLLFTSTLLLNMVASRFVNRFRERY